MTQTPPAPQRNMQSFLLVWFGQLISIIGSSLTSFAMGVWIYQRTGSVTQFALIVLLAELPSVIVAPLVGALVDRWNRRWILILSDTGSALVTLALVALYFLNQLDILPILILLPLGAICRTFQSPAYMAAMSLLVPKDQLARANGLLQLSQALPAVISPLLAGTLMVTIGLPGIFAVDFATFLFAMIMTFMISIPQPPRSAAGQEGQGSIWTEAAQGWRYIATRQGLFGLLAFAAVINFVIAMVQVLIPPLILSFTTAAILGIVLAGSNVGLLVGSILMGIWGGPKRRIDGVLGFSVLFGICVALAGLQPSAWLIGAAFFGVTLVAPIITSSNQAIWQIKTDLDVQGRVFAFRGMVASIFSMAAYLAAGLLSDYVFEPLLAANGPLAASVGVFLGTGAGRGIGLLFICIGALPVLAGLLGYLNPHVRQVETELPDVVQEPEPAPAAA